MRPTCQAVTKGVRCQRAAAYALSLLAAAWATPGWTPALTCGVHLKQTMDTQLARCPAVVVGAL